MHLKFTSVLMCMSIITEQEGATALLRPEIYAKTCKEAIRWMITAFYRKLARQTLNIL